MMVLSIIREPQMGPIDPLTGESAVHQVLAAERVARERIAAARAEAEQALEQARAEARTTEQRAVETTQRVQQAARRFGEQRLARLKTDTERLLDQARRDHPEAAIDVVAVRLARELIDGDTNSGPESDRGT